MKLIYTITSICLLGQSIAYVLLLFVVSVGAEQYIRDSLENRKK